MPAATCAEYSPRLCPATIAGSTPRDASSATRGNAHRENRGLGVFGQRQASAGPLKISSLSGSPSAASASSNTSRHFGKLLGEGLPHPDRLRALPGKKEGNHWLGHRLAGRNLLLDPAEHVAADESRRHRHRVAHRLGRRAAVADDAQPGDAHQRRAAVFRIIHAPAEPAKRPPRQQVAHLARKRALQLLAEQLLDHLHQPFAQLERDVAGEAVTHDHVGLTREDVARFDVADKVQPRAP